jgi:hypothetical protein
VLRRVLPVAAAAAVVLVPSAAWATPAQAPVDTFKGSSYSGFANDIVLSNGWHAIANLGKGSDTTQRQGWGFVSLEVWDPSHCVEDDGCYAPHQYWSAQLTAGQVDFDRNLRTASVRNLTVELPDPTYVPEPVEEDPWIDGEDPGTGGDDPWIDGEDPGTGEVDPGTGEVDPGTGEVDPGTGEVDPGTGEVDPGTGEVDPGTGEDDTAPDPDPSDFPQPPTITLSVTLTFTGTGPVAHSADHQTICGDGEGVCQSVRVYSNRAALARLTLGEWSGDASSADLSFTQGIDAAERKSQNVGF